MDRKFLEELCNQHERRAVAGTDPDSICTTFGLTDRLRGGNSVPPLEDCFGLITSLLQHLLRACSTNTILKDTKSWRLKRICQKLALLSILGNFKHEIKMAQRAAHKSMCIEFSTLALLLRVSSCYLLSSNKPRVIGELKVPWVEERKLS